ncbi:MAG TPA: hypothetical protein VM489_08590 [Burkholderiales bacterium]|nr:hypothetical protein [Burkholderiales bacterium]
MKRIALDYLAPRRRTRWPGLALLGASLAVAAALGLRYDAVLAELARLQAHGEAQRGLLDEARRATAPLARDRLEEDAKAAEAVMRRLTLPWSALVRAVEQTATRDVALLQLVPDAEGRTVRIAAEARHRDAMFEYLRRLGAARELAEVHLVSHEVRRGDAQHPVQFAVQAALRSAP